MNKKIKLTTHPKYAYGYVLIDSPYNITFYSQTDSWCPEYQLKNNVIKTLISGTIIQPYKNGSLYKKSALSLTIEQLKKEIVQQFFDSVEFKDLVSKNNNGYKLTKNDIVYVEIYDDWYYDKSIKSLKTHNKKWVNNFLNEIRTNQKTTFPNLLGGSHTKTSYDIWVWKV